MGTMQLLGNVGKMRVVFHNLLILSRLMILASYCGRCLLCTIVIYYILSSKISEHSEDSEHSEWADTARRVPTVDRLTDIVLKVDEKLSKSACAGEDSGWGKCYQCETQIGGSKELRSLGGENGSGLSD